MMIEKSDSAVAPQRYCLEGLREMNPGAMWTPFFINPAIALMNSYDLKPFPCTVACEDIVSAILPQMHDEITVEFDWLVEPEFCTLIASGRNQ